MMHTKSGVACMDGLCRQQAVHAVQPSYSSLQFLRGMLAGLVWPAHTEGAAPPRGLDVLHGLLGPSQQSESGLAKPAAPPSTAESRPATALLKAAVSPFRAPHGTTLPPAEVYAPVPAATAPTLPWVPSFAGPFIAICFSAVLFSLLRKFLGDARTLRTLQEPFAPTQEAAKAAEAVQIATGLQQGRTADTVKVADGATGASLPSKGDSTVAGGEAHAIQAYLLRMYVQVSRSECRA